MTDAIELVCRACTRTISLDPPLREALATAEGFGWKPDGHRVVCPKCKGGKQSNRVMMNAAARYALETGQANPGDVLECVLHGERIGTVTV